MAGAVRTVPALPPGALRVGYSGTPEDQEKKRLEHEWSRNVEKISYRGAEYWIPLEKDKKSDKPKSKGEVTDKPGTKGGGKQI